GGCVLLFKKSLDRPAENIQNSKHRHAGYCGPINSQNKLLVPTVKFVVAMPVPCPTNKLVPSVRGIGCQTIGGVRLVALCKLTPGRPSQDSQTCLLVQLIVMAGPNEGSVEVVVPWLPKTSVGMV